jgi:hypothetical protein
MAGYNGDTLSLLVGPIGGTGLQIWTMRSTDNAATVDASGYITDGGKRGMRVGDWVLQVDTDDAALLTSGHTVVTVSSTYPGAVDLSNGITVGGGSNSD